MFVFTIDNLPISFNKPTFKVLPSLSREQQVHVLACNAFYLLYVHQGNGGQIANIIVVFLDSHKLFDRHVM